MVRSRQSSLKNNMQKPFHLLPSPNVEPSSVIGFPQPFEVQALK